MSISYREEKRHQKQRTQPVSRIDEVKLNGFLLPDNIAERCRHHESEPGEHADFECSYRSLGFPRAEEPVDDVCGYYPGDESDEHAHPSARFAALCHLGCDVHEPHPCVAEDARVIPQKADDERHK